MKKIFILLVVTSSILACKKTTTTTPTSTTNSVTCGDNPNIKFTCIGTPIGKFGDCITDVDGNVYKTVTIGTQTWMAENLKVSKYNDGTTIPKVTDSIQWSKLNTGAYCYYNNDFSNNAKYGKLYNWYVINLKTSGNKNICPIGWHIPSYTEWTTLTDYLGGTAVAGGKMKEVGTSNWNTPNTKASNISLFTAIPGGVRYENEQFIAIGDGGGWWTTEEYYSTYNSYNDSAWFMALPNDDGGVVYKFFNKSYGQSVRCIKN